MPAVRTHAHAALIPGIVLAVALAVVARLAAYDPVSPVLCAVVIGVLWRNLIGTGARTEPGLRWVTQRLLTIGIAMIGLRLTLAGFASVAASAIPIVICCIGSAIFVTNLVGRAFGVTATLRRLIALGTAVCGCTAIAAASSQLRARPAETGLAVTCIVLFGCLGMLLYPWLADAIFAGNANAAGVFLGTAIHDTSQVIGAAMIYAQQFAAPEVVPAAGATKFLRNLSLLIFIPLLGVLAARDADSRDDHSSDRQGGAVLRNAIPGYVVAFVLLILIRTAGDSIFMPLADGPGQAALAWQSTLSAGQTIGDLLLTCGMTAVGLSVSLAQIKELGWRPVATAMAAAVCTAVVALTLCFFLLPATPLLSN